MEIQRQVNHLFQIRMKVCVFQGDRLFVVVLPRVGTLLIEINDKFWKQDLNVAAKFGMVPKPRGYVATEEEDIFFTQQIKETEVRDQEGKRQRATVKNHEQ
jgi:hypothetical protein